MIGDRYNNRFTRLILLTSITFNLCFLNLKVPTMNFWIPLRRLSHPRELVRQFTPNWFTLNMGTGIVFLMLAQFPYKVDGLHSIAFALFWLDAVIFTVFSLLFIARWAVYTQDALPLLRHPVQSMFLGAIPMALIPLVNGLVLFYPNSTIASALSYQLWWVDFALALLTGWLVPWYQFVFQEHSLEQMTGVWLLPVVPAEVTASSAGYLAQHLPAAQAQTLVLSGYALWGVSVPVAMGILALLYLRLSLYKLPAKELGVSSWLALGPIGTGAFALQTLGAAAQHALVNPELHAFAAIAAPIGTFGALILWGFGLWWLVIAAGMTIRQASQQLPFNLGWWGFTFPVGVYIAATLALGQHTGAGFFTIFAAALTVGLVGAWMYVVVRSLHGLWHGHMIKAPCLQSSGTVDAKTNPTGQPVSSQPTVRKVRA